MRKIFISYRREDTAFETTAIYKELEDVFGKKNVFLDEESIAKGENFEKRINSTLARTTATVVVIGPDWLDARDENGNRRLDSTNDWVRREIEAALQFSDRTLVPVLVRGVSWPPEKEDLPESLRPLWSRNSQVIRPGNDYDHDIESLIEALGGKKETKPSSLQCFGRACICSHCRRRIFYPIQLFLRTWN